MLKKDTYKHKGQRQQLVGLLEQKGIENKAVLDAINRVPRHLFLDSVFEPFAYQDKAFAIGAGQTISHPFTVAFQTQLLNVQPNDKVLEIGTGSGYQTAVLVALKAVVYSVERQKELFDFSSELLSKLNLKPRYQSFSDGFKGLPSFAPFDKIIVTAGAAEVPIEVLKQLKIGGIAVIPIGKEEQKMMTFLRINQQHFERLEFGDFHFVPMLEDKRKN